MLKVAVHVPILEVDHAKRLLDLRLLTPSGSLDGLNHNLVGDHVRDTLRVLHIEDLVGNVLLCEEHVEVGRRRFVLMARTIGYPC